MRGRTEHVFHSLGAVLLLLVFRPVPALANTITAINIARSAYCTSPRATRPPLIESRRLDRVARLLAHGAPLERAEAGAGYSAARSVSIRIAGAQGSAAVAQLLGRRFCGQIADPRLRQVGAYGRGDSGLWIVVAEPFTTPRLQDSGTMSELVLALTNQARARARTCGSRRFPAAPPLSLATSLTRAARAQSMVGAAGSDDASAGTES